MATAIPVEVRYQHGKGIEEVVAYAYAEGLDTLADLLRRQDEHTLDLQVLLSRPAMEDVTILNHLHILPSETPVDIQVDVDTLVIRGTHASRMIVADGILLLRRQGPGRYGSDIHFDYLPGTPHLLPRAQSFVVVYLKNR